MTYLMISKIRIIYCILLIFLIQNKVLLAKENKILFKINDEIITSYDILQQTEYLSILNPNFSKLNTKEKFQISKDELIKQKIKKFELNKIVKEFSVDDKIIQNTLRPILSQLNIKNLNQFENYLITKPINIDVIKKKIIIEILWNELIFLKFSKSVKIDKENLIEIIKNKKLKKSKTYHLSEIIFKTKTKTEYNKTYNQIKTMIDDEGFEKAALRFSLSDTSKTGGILGWIKEDGLSQQIKKNLSKVNINNYTDPINIPSGFLILKINDIKETEIETDVDKELERLIKFKTDQQLRQFSNIFFNKLKKDITINEL